MSSSHPVQQPPPIVPPVVVPGTRNNVIINPLQRGNLVLEHIRNVGKEFGDIVADYQVGRTTGVLFLSLKYHRLHPEYIHGRVEKLGLSYTLRILLILCDISDHRQSIRELTKMCLINNVTVLVAFSFEEAGHYLSTFKRFEHKPPDMIKERVDKDYPAMLRTALTSISKVNKTDVETLRTSFGSFARIAKATPDQLQNLSGFGQVKVKNVKNAFEKPFRNRATNTLVESMQQGEQPAQAHPSSTSSDLDIPTSSTSQLVPTAATALTSESSGLTSSGNSSGGPMEGVREASPAWDIELDLNEDDDIEDF